MDRVGGTTPAPAAPRFDHSTVMQLTGGKPEHTGTELLDLKQRIKEMWAGGDWPAIASRIDAAAGALVNECSVGPAHSVLDVAAGNGNAAVWAARAGARVVATDLSPALVEHGRRRCASEGLEVEWREADMEDLPFADNSFDSVLNAFGIGFATRPEVAMAEMFRVARPGGCIALANWTRWGWAARMAAIVERHLRPASEGGPSSPGHSAGAVAVWLLDNASAVRMQRGVLREGFGSAQAWWDHWDASSPQMAMARQALSERQYHTLRDELIAAASAAGSGDGDGCQLDSEYLIVVATKRAADGSMQPRVCESASLA